MPPTETSSDKRIIMLDAAMKKHQFQADALLEILHRAQELFGYLQTDLLIHIARKLKLPPSRVYGVATFYHFFTFNPKGVHNCNVCLGTACYVKGAALVQEALEKALGVTAGQTRADGQASLSLVRCIGTCGLAPLAVFDEKVVGNLTPGSATAEVKGWIAHGAG